MTMAMVTAMTMMMKRTITTPPAITLITTSSNTSPRNNFSNHAHAGSNVHKRALGADSSFIRYAARMVIVFIATVPLSIPKNDLGSKSAHVTGSVFTWAAVIATQVGFPSCAWRNVHTQPRVTSSGPFASMPIIVTIISIWAPRSNHILTRTNSMTTGVMTGRMMSSVAVRITTVVITITMIMIIPSQPLPIPLH